MKRSQVEHVLRAAAAISQEQSFVVVGSQAILLPFPDAPAEHLAVSKCVAAREKDADFIRGLLRHQMIGLDLLLTRIAQLDAARYPVKQIADWARRRASEAKP